MIGLALGACALIERPASAAPPVAQDPTAWPPPMVVGMRLAAQSSAPRRVWCDFAAHAKARSVVKYAQDPLFRKLAPEPQAAFDEVRKALIAAKPGTKAHRAAETALQNLLLGPDASGMARVALSDAESKVFVPALRFACAVAPGEPRIIGFAGQHLKSKDPQVVLAAATLLFAANCDSPLDYVLDALENDDAAVQTGVLQLVFRSALDHTTSPTLARVAQWLDAGGGTTATRVLALRILGVLAWQPTVGILERLTKEAEPAVAGEALASLAVLGAAMPATVQAFLTDPSPLRRAGAIRAIAQMDAMRPERVRAQVTPLLSDKAPVTDAAATGKDKPPTVGELAQRALDYAEVR